MHGGPGLILINFTCDHISFSPCNYQRGALQVKMPLGAPAPLIKASVSDSLCPVPASYPNACSAVESDGATQMRQIECLALV